jgi:hypothetical protein
VKDWKTAALLLGAVRTVHGMVTGKREREREREKGAVAMRQVERGLV